MSTMSQLKAVLLLVACNLHTSTGLSILVLPNGGNVDGKLVTLPAAEVQGAELSIALAGHLPWTERGEAPFFVSERAVMFSSNRNNLNAASMLEALKDGERLFVVPAHRQFIHPVDKLGQQTELAVLGPNGKPIVLTPLAQEPRILHVANLMSEEGMDALMEEARPKIFRSTVGEGKDATKGIHVADPKNRHAEQVDTRTSMNAWVQFSAPAKEMKKRVQELLAIQTDSGNFDDKLMDGLQVVRYQKGQAYNTHMDYMPPSNPLFNWDPAQNGSNRLATVFLYLKTPKLGGQTSFPRGNASRAHLTHRSLSHEGGAPTGQKLDSAIKAMGAQEWATTLSQKCFQDLAVYPRRGDAIVFYNQFTNGVADEDAHHAGCPVVKGEKWGANVWVWNKLRMGEPGSVPETAMSVNFQIRSGSGLSAKVYWIPPDNSRDKHLIVELSQARLEFASRTFHSHRFDAYVMRGDAEHFVGSVVASQLAGLLQNWLVTDSSVTRIDGNEGNEKHPEL